MFHLRRCLHWGQCVGPRCAACALTGDSGDLDFLSTVPAPSPVLGALKVAVVVLVQPSLVALALVAVAKTLGCGTPGRNALGVRACRFAPWVADVRRSRWHAVCVCSAASTPSTPGPPPLARATALRTLARLAGVALLLSVLTLPGAHAVVSPGERQGLVNLYLATNGPGWAGITQGWHNHANASVDPCDPPSTAWSRVTCGGTTSITYVFHKVPAGSDL